MIMVIECGTCGSRFRLAKSLFKDSRAIRVRCRKCGGNIVVENPDAVAVAEPPPPEPVIPLAPEPVPPLAPEPAPEPAPDHEPAPEPEPVSEPEPPRLFSQEIVPPAPENPAAAMAELLREIEQENDTEAAEPPEAGETRDPSRDLPPELTRYPDSSYGTEALASALEELFKQQPPQPATDWPAPDWEVVPSAARAIPKEPQGNAAPRKERTEANRPRPPYANPTFVALAVLWLLLLAGGAYLFGTGFFGKQGPLGSPSDDVAPQVYEIGGVSYFPDNAVDGGAILAVKGNVTNIAKAESGDVRIRATLLGKDNEVLQEMEVLAGNRIEAEVLRTMNRDDVQRFLTRKAGVREIPLGVSIPFMAVFYNPPEKVASVEVRAVPPPGK